MLEVTSEGVLQVPAELWDFERPWAPLDAVCYSRGCLLGSQPGDWGGDPIPGFQSSGHVALGDTGQCGLGSAPWSERAFPI